MIRPMTNEDIDDVTGLYINYMYDSFLSKFHSDFLRIIFKKIVDSKYGISYIYEETSIVRGFIIASTDTEELFREVFKKIAFGDNFLLPISGDFRSPSRFDLRSKSGGDLGKILYTFLCCKKQIFYLSRLILFSLVKTPSLLLRILESFIYFRKTDLKDIKAEFLFITIEPRYRSRGISKELIAIVMKELSRRAVFRAKVSIRKKNQVVNNLLKTLGFSLIKSFVFYGRENLLYEVTFAVHEEHC